MMTNFSYFAVCLMLIPCASAGSSSLRSSQGAPSQAFRALDANQDGHVDPNEAAAFAQSEGLGSASAQDFADIDTNMDSSSNSAQLLQVFGAGAPVPSTVATAAKVETLTAAKVEPTTASALPVKAAAKVEPVTVQQASPHVVSVSGLAGEKPSAAMHTSKKEPHISIQAQKLAQKVPPSQPVISMKVLPSQPVLPKIAPEALPKVVPEALPKIAPVFEVKASGVTEVVKPPPVERMVKHFAQVMREADIAIPETKRPKAAAAAGTVIPAAVATAAAAAVPALKAAVPAVRATVVAASSGDIAQNSRSSVQSAAKEVAEQLALAESAEAKARVLDRRAAEERANATVLAKLTTQQALNAAAAAAHSKANELLAKIGKLEDEAERAQVRSAALHSKAKLETEEASELMAVADRALNRDRV